MNKSLIERVTEAKMYQKKALQALLPENTAEHVEVIERELRAIFMECMKGMMKQDGARDSEKESRHQEAGAGKQTKRVNIE